MIEEPTIAGRVAKIATSLKTTAVLGSILAGIGAGVGIATAVSTRILVGRAAPEVIKFGAARFATNPKTIGLTTSLLSKAGLSLGAASLAVGAIGSYPFAGFIKEEAVQTLNIAIFQAVRAGDEEGARRLIEEVDELINARGSIVDKIPYANVLSNLNKFFDAAGEANEEWKRILDIEAEKLEEPSFEETREASDTAARQRQLLERETDAEYFRLIREGKFEEAEELLQSELKGGR